MDKLKKQYHGLLKNIDFKKYKGYPAYHFPGIGAFYKKAQYKIAFVGKETNGWIDFSELNPELKNHWDVDEYLDYSSRCINELDILNDRKRTFWQFVLQILSHIYTTNYYDIDETHEKILKSYIWANLNILECPETIIKNNKKMKFNNLKYEKLKALSSSVNILHYLIKYCKPNVIFVADWVASTDLLNPLSYSIDYKGDGVWIIGLKDYNTIIVWTYHPRYMVKIGGIEKFTNKIFKELKKFNILTMF